MIKYLNPFYAATKVDYDGLFLSILISLSFMGSIVLAVIFAGCFIFWDINSSIIRFVCVSFLITYFGNILIYFKGDK